ncbi:hypothetical protein [Treponema zioleckii]|uniref:hypothetical protein n=1 Tax=Treponema zioleckii TaxID=331680 RepID=UPI0018D7220F|nr:hypothetical protein [Treponema zioleckii]
MMVFPVEDKNFYVQHLAENPANLTEINSFSISRESGAGLENYLKNIAPSDEESSFARTYLVKSKSSHEIAAYFTLRNGLFTLELNDDNFYTIPAIELSNFAVNSVFHSNHPEIEKIGYTVLSDFVLPIVNFIRSFSGVKALYIYALPEDKLISHYERMGFRRLAPEKEKFVHSHVKPKYDDGCIFMYQLLA